MRKKFKVGLKNQIKAFFIKNVWYNIQKYRFKGKSMLKNIEKKADIGVFGGSGFYEFTKDIEEIKIETPYGSPSDKIALATVDGKKVAFLPRHGKGHGVAPHMINYRANLWAMKSIGVTKIIGPCASGSLQKNIEPGSFVICDQFVDRTKGRKDTFYDGPIATHVACAHPYCDDLRTLAILACKEANVEVHNKGTVVVIQGPRFSTSAESKWFTQAGWEVINMTQYPEAYLARELEMCYVNISLITDYDAGLEGEVEAVTIKEIIKVFTQNIDNLKKVLKILISKIPEKRECDCPNILSKSRFNP